MRLLRFLLAGVIGFLCVLSAHAQTLSALSTEERAYVASRLYSALNTHFAQWDDAQDVDLDAAYRAYLSAALAVPDRRTFTLESQAFLAQFRNGHTIFMDRGLMGTPEGERVGFTLQQVQGQWVVATSEIPELRPGDVVTAIDGAPFETFYRDVRRYLPASTEAWARHVLFEDIPGFYSGLRRPVLPASLHTLAWGRARGNRRPAGASPARPSTNDGGPVAPLGHGGLRASPQLQGATL